VRCCTTSAREEQCHDESPAPGRDPAQASAALGAKHAKPGEQVVALACAGQDLSKYRLRYSHFDRVYKTHEGP